MGAHGTAGGRLRWVGSAALLLTSIWTGVAGGFGLYTRQVGAAKAWTAVAVAVAAVESGKLFGRRTRPHPLVAQHKVVHPGNPPPTTAAFHQ